MSDSPIEKPKVYIETAPIIRVGKDGSIPLSVEDKAVFDVVSKLKAKYNLDCENEAIDEEKLTEISDKIAAYFKTLVAEGIDPGKYIIWHKISGSGIGSVISESASATKSFADEEYYFDTQDRRIEEFIKDLFHF